MLKKTPNKMISNKDQSAYHFSGAGSNLKPMVITASSLQEAEAIWRKLNAEAGTAPIGSYDDETTNSESSNSL